MLQNLSSAAVVIHALRVNLISLPTAQEQCVSLACPGTVSSWLNDRHKMTEKLLEGSLDPKVRS